MIKSTLINIADHIGLQTAHVLEPVRCLGYRIADDMAYHANMQLRRMGLGDAINNRGLTVRGLVGAARRFLDGNTHVDGGGKVSHMAQEKKWLIQPKRTLSADERRAYWEQEHGEGYGNVFSTLQCPDFRAKIVSTLTEHGRIQSILIPGCGSYTHLQEDLAANGCVREICCTDYPAVIDVAKRNFVHQKITYLTRDSAALGFANKWDAVVNINAVLSESDKENRAILRSSYDALRPGGIFLGVFPTLFCAVELDVLNPELQWKDRIDVKNSSFHESKQGVDQIFYTPLRLRRMMKESGFDIERLEIVFCDSEFFKTRGAEYYGLPDEDSLIYELLVVARKPIG